MAEEMRDLSGQKDITQYTSFRTTKIHFSIPLTTKLKILTLTFLQNPQKVF